MIEDNPAFENFVNPQLCLNLLKCGLSRIVNYHWSMNGSQLSLKTNLFDPDGYYSNVDLFLDSLSGTQILPAYSVKDIEKCLPSVELKKTSGSYVESEVDYEVRLPLLDMTMKANRLPDAFAKALLECLIQGVVPLVRINYVLNLAASKNTIQQKTT